MASAHHHHPPACYCCCCYGCSYSTSCSSSSPTAAAPYDPLHYALAAQLLRSKAPQQYLFQNHDERQRRPRQVVLPHQHDPEVEVQRHQYLRTGGGGGLLQSLIRRVAALESSLPTDLSSPISKIPHPPRPSPQSSTSRITLRDSAARVIQVEFRRYLVRRSQVLRALRRLSYVRSRLATLKFSTHHGDHPRALCREAADLLLHLDSIQNEDSMVCEEKMSISREIAGIVESLERRIPVQRRTPFQVSSPCSPAKQETMLSKQGGDGVVLMEAEVENDNNVVSCDGSSLRTSSSEDDNKEEEEGDQKGEEESQQGEAADCYRRGGSGFIGKVGLGGKGNTTTTNKNSYNNHIAPRLGLDAPLPVKMETRRSSQLGGVLGTIATPRSN